VTIAGLEMQGRPDMMGAALVDRAANCTGYNPARLFYLS